MKNFPDVNAVLILLSYPSPLSGIFQVSLLTKTERISLVKLSNGEFLSTRDLHLIFIKMKSLQQLFNSLPPRVNQAKHLSLHPIIHPLLTRILRKIDALYKHPTRKLVEYSAEINDYFNYFRSHF